ncbi:hypothetical protein [Singulisphaera sp. PoT]|uniref:hypothetical protein n=1 Tax=Singulisphaera sp. PoT TaxID=3411797 RepID=UPI003BF480D1
MFFLNRTRQAKRRPRSMLLERLESRELLSVAPIYMARQESLVSGAPAVQAILTRAGTTNPSETAAAADSSATPQPTARELLRQRYTAKLSGTYTTGPGRYTDQVMQGYVTTSGSSNQSLNIDMQLRFFTYTDPSEPISGVAALIPRNTSTTGSNLILDLSAPAPTTPGKLPTHFTWTVDPTSGGLYTSAGTLGGGSGTLDIHYRPTGAGRGRVTTMGKAFVVINGLVNADGIFNNLGVMGNRA